MAIKSVEYECDHCKRTAPGIVRVPHWIDIPPGWFYGATLVDDKRVDADVCSSACQLAHEAAVPGRWFWAGRFT